MAARVLQSLCSIPVQTKSMADFFQGYLQLSGLILLGNDTVDTITS